MTKEQFIKKYASGYYDEFVKNLDDLISEGSCPLHGEKKMTKEEANRLHKPIDTDISYPTPTPIPDSEETMDWEKEFDENRKNRWHYLDVNNEYTQEVKRFIRTVLALQKARMVEVVEGKKQVINPKKVSDVILEQEIKYINEGLSLAQKIISEDK